jgi:hypothetical protein
MSDTTTPYSDAWREHTRERLARLGVTYVELYEATGLDPNSFAFATPAAKDHAITLETTEPIEEWLREQEGKRQRRPARSLTVPVDRSGEVVPVACDLSALTNCDISPELRAKLDADMDRVTREALGAD